MDEKILLLAHFFNLEIIHIPHSATYLRKPRDRLDRIEMLSSLKSDRKNLELVSKHNTRPSLDTNEVLHVTIFKLTQLLSDIYGNLRACVVC